MTEPLLELRGVDKSFGPVQVLHGVDLKVYPGQVTALVGDNGAGKSTLVKTIAGIYHADAGEFFFEGKPVTINGPKDAAAPRHRGRLPGPRAVRQPRHRPEHVPRSRDQDRRAPARRADAWRTARADARLALGAHREVGAPERLLPLRWPAPDRGHRQGGALELPSGAARRADRCARCRPDPPGARPRPPPGRPGPRRRADLAQHERRASRSPTASPPLFLGRVAADLKTSETNHSQIVELITAGRSGSIGISAATANESA